MVAAYELNDAAVERRARRADTVVVWYAVCTSVVAAGLGFGELHACVTSRAWSVDVSVAVLVGVFTCAASGLWCLAAATARGSATALKVVAIMLLVCMGILVVQIGVLRLHNASVRLMLLYTLLVFIWAAAVKKRMHVMLECERRGLWQRIFAPAQPTRRLLWLGSSLLGLANVLLARYFFTR